ncbi:diketogulonate reductase-like aldo/keto reductase [Haloarcula quadrata]|jgi:diketogulonate reductase-like aldo/keto reductase|uniref:Diketogulonate reductase-like aldo/keto reductase n=1 Tax=Haloarcula quadrata TaxID=182779 RepID=A0A495R924_9EURY|nr:aldo/keto reductase [Haloarcula quadrata]RKS83857.1 diketogulonate reductase-like aldo/keto reductase [Haloarcula quadrata]
MDDIQIQGTSVPALGLGTWQLTGQSCRETVETALGMGYRHIDTAQAYGNERQVGLGMDAAAVDREDVFLTTKLDGSNRDERSVRRSTRESLNKLGTDYLDLLLIHWPNTPWMASLSETLGAMNDLVEEGLVRHIGVSNFSPSLLDRARDISSAPIFTDQVQYHPYWDQRKLLDYCRIHDVLLTAYSPLARGGVLDDPALVQIGNKYGKSPAQVALRWLVQQDGVAAIPKASSREHLEANLAVFDFELTDAEMERIRDPSKVKTGVQFVRSQLPF